jgi:hypothetical protein
MRHRLPWDEREAWLDRSGWVYSNEAHYPTPIPDVRSIVYRDGKVSKDERKNAVPLSRWRE